MRYARCSLFVLLLTGACGGSTPSAPTSTPPPSAPTQTPPATRNGTLRATINGVDWNAISIIALVDPSLLTISGSDVAPQAVSLLIPPAVGTYPVNFRGPASAGVRAGGQTWLTLPVDPRDNGSSGSIVVSTLTSTGASGTFSFVAPASPLSGATGVKTVTNGTFNVTF